MGDLGGRQLTGRMTQRPAVLMCLLSYTGLWTLPPRQISIFKVGITGKFSFSLTKFPLSALLTCTSISWVYKEMLHSSRDCHRSQRWGLWQRCSPFWLRSRCYDCLPSLPSWPHCGFLKWLVTTLSRPWAWHEHFFSANKLSFFKIHL